MINSPHWLTALYSFLLHDLLVLGLIPVVLLRRKEPAATLAWILAILLMPIVGAVCFLIFGNDRMQRRVRKRQSRKRSVGIRVADMLASLTSPVDVKGQLQMYRLLDHINPLPAVPDNGVTVTNDMADYYEQQLEAINRAERTVHFEYYIVQPDTCGERFKAALIAAAKRGVTVRFLYDAVGSIGLTRAYLAKLREAGVETACFLPVSPFRRRWVFNFRNHRKLLVVDSAIAFTGGANIGVEYVQPNWRDLGMRLVGPIVPHLQRIFAEDWSFATGEELVDPALYRRPEAAGEEVAQVVAGGPDLDFAVYHELYFSAVSNAANEVRIATPYFVPNEALMTALVTSARRGVKIAILVPRVNSHLFVQRAAESYYQELLNAGVQIYEYGPGFIHSKAISVDGRWCWIGTANCDNRSFRLNFEIGVAFYSPEVTTRLDELLDQDFSVSRALNSADWRSRSVFRQVTENFARLFSSIL